MMKNYLNADVAIISLLLHLDHPPTDVSLGRYSGFKYKIMCKY